MVDSSTKCMGKRLNYSPAVLNDKERCLKVSDGAMRPRQRFRVARSCTMVSMIFCVVSTLENYYKSKFDLSPDRLWLEVHFFSLRQMYTHRFR